MSDLLTRIHTLMAQNDIKPTQFTKILGISSSSFTDWGKGKGSPSLKTVSQISEYFNVSIDYLVYGNDKHTISVLDFSNTEDSAMLEKFHQLTPELRRQALAYMDGMVSAMSAQNSREDARLLG